MPRFTQDNRSDLKNFLFESKVHDSSLDIFSYDCNQKKLTIEASNRINMTKLNLEFFGIYKIVVDNEQRWCEDETILSLSLEDADFPHCLSSVDLTTSHLYFLIQLFSGVEIHIVSTGCQFSKLAL